MNTKEQLSEVIDLAITLTAEWHGVEMSAPHLERLKMIESVLRHMRADSVVPDYPIVEYVTNHKLMPSSNVRRRVTYGAGTPLLDGEDWQAVQDVDDAYQELEMRREREREPGDETL